MTDQRSPVHQRTLELLARAERIGGLGSFEWKPETGELLWSDNLFRLYGYEPGAVEPSVERFLSHVHPDDRAHAEAAIGERRLEGLRLRFVRPEGTVAHFEVFMDEAEGGDTLVGSLRDVTERRRADREIAAHIAVTEVLDRWRSLEESARDLLAQLGAAFDARFALLWAPVGGELLPRAAWSCPGDATAAGEAAASAAGRGRSLAAAAWRRGTPGITPVAGEPRTALTIPAPSESDVLAVVKLQVEEDIEPTERLQRTLTGIGHELGHFLHHRRGELAHGPLTVREIEVLQLAAHGRAGREIADELGISPATVKRHFESIYDRLEVTDRAAAVAEAMRRGLVG